MNLLDIYSLLEKGELTQEEAAKALDLTEADLKYRLTRWGHRLPLMLATLDKIKADRITRAAAAELLNVTPREINNLMNNWSVKRPIKEYAITRETSKVKWEIRKKFAIEYIAGQSTLEDAAARACVSERQIRRWVADLLAKHFQLQWKDHAKLSLQQMTRMADEIERKENLEMTKINTINSIACGAKTEQEEALDRILATKAKRIKP